MNILEKPYPRAKRLIRQSFLSLLEKKSLEGVTIKEICSLSQLNRSTFYDHYEDKYHLLEEITRDFIQGFTALVVEVQSAGKEQFVRHILSGCHPGFIKYFQYFRTNQLVFDVLLRDSSGVSIGDRIAEALMTVGIVSYTDYQSNESQSQPLYLYFACKQISDFYVIWARDGMRQADEVIAALLTSYWCRNLFPPKID